MEAYQSRVVEERDQLAERMTKLMNWINSPSSFLRCPVDEMNRLLRQASAMRTYLDILNERIAAFGENK